MSRVLFEEDAVEAAAAYGLTLVKENAVLFLKGTLSIVDSDEMHWHTYEVEIHYNDEYPHMFPTVFETGGAIRRIADWHINEDNGSCCIDNEFSQQIKCFEGLHLNAFIEVELKPWLANQSYRRVYGVYVNGEQEHGNVGRLTFFMQELGAPNLHTCVKWMSLLALNKLPSRQAQCICGSSVKWRHCHKPAFDKLKRISPEALHWALNTFYGYIEAGPAMVAEMQRHTKVNIL